MPGDEITASGQIVLDGNLLLGSGFGSTSAGTVDTLIDNTGSQAITGTFSGLAQGAIFDVAGPSSGGTWYQISYQGGSGSKSVTITALGAPPATFAGNTSYDIDYNRQTSIGIAGDDTQGDGVLANEAGAYSATLVSGTNTGSSLQDFGGDGDFYYQSVGNDLNPDSFTFDASNGTVTTNPITVGINVVDTPPVANNDAYTVAAKGTLDVSGIGVLTNDYDGEDALKSGHSVQQLSGPLRGSLSRKSTGCFVCTPCKGPFDVGPDSVTAAPGERRAIVPIWQSRSGRNILCFGSLAEGRRVVTPKNLCFARPCQAFTTLYNAAWLRFWPRLAAVAGRKDRDDPDVALRVAQSWCFWPNGRVPGRAWARHLSKGTPVELWSLPWHGRTVRRFEQHKRRTTSRVLFSKDGNGYSGCGIADLIIAAIAFLSGFVLKSMYPFTVP